MSGYLGLLSAAASLLVRPAPLVIGGLVLEGHEVPARVSIGGAQAVTIHKTPGGGRIIDAMGADPGAIAWRGMFVGPDAAQRARQVDFMRQQGGPYALSFADYMFNVVVVHFEYDYQDQGAVISYRIRTEIVPDPDDLTGSASGVDLAMQGDLANAQVVLQAGAASVSRYAALGGAAAAASGVVSAAAMGSVAASLAATSSMIANTVTGSPSGYAQIQGSLTATAATISTAINAASAGSLAAPAGGLFFASAPALAAATAQAAALAALVRGSGYLNRTNSNLASAMAQLPAPLVHS